MADDSNEIQISITLDDGSVRTGFARIQKQGEDTGKSLSDAFSGVEKRLLAVIAAYVSFETAKRFIEDAINAASSYDKALNDMNKSLAAAGAYTDQASQQFVALAEATEASTTIDAKKVLSLEAMARNYARTNEQALALTKAAIELGAATGKGPDFALQQLGGTLDGTAGRLSKLVPQVKSMTEYQLRMGDAIGLVAARFKGSAEADVNTYEGSIQRLGNAFEKFQRTLGELVTQSPTVRAVIRFLTSEFGQLAQYLSKLGGNDNFMKGLINDALDFGRAINDVVITPLELMKNVIQVVFTSIELAITGTLSVISGVAGKIIGFFKKDSDLAQSLNDFSEQSKLAAKSFADEWNKSVLQGGVGVTKFSDAVGEGLNKIQSVVNSSHPLAGFKKDIAEIKEDALGLSGPLESVAQSFTLMGQGITGAMNIMAKNAIKAFQDIGTTAIKSLAGGVAQGMAAMGKALVQGTNLFQAFAGALLSAMGQAAIQMGSFYILQGIARGLSSYGFDATATGLIAVGSSLAVLGGALEAVGSGVSGAGSASTSAGSYSSSSPSAGPSGTIGNIAGNPATQLDAQKNVQIHIHGSVFDSQETGLRIVELVNAAFTGQGVSVLTGA